jgi:mandelate racemase
MAQVYGTPLSSHLWPEVSAHLLAVTPTCDWLEYVDWAAPVLQEPISIVAGSAQIPDRPGNGMQWDARAVERLRLP